MRITPRGEETAALIDVLNDPSLDTPAKAAKAVFKAVAGMLDLRDWCFLMLADSARFGPYSSPAEAERIGKLSGLDYRVVTLAAPGLLYARLTDEPLFWKGMCKTCGHFPDMHLATDEGRCAYNYGPNYPDTTPCRCKKLVKIT